MPASDTFVSVVVALRDDADVLEAFVAETTAVLESSYANFELVLVDDGSTDGTTRVVDGLLARFKCVRYLRLARRYGREIAVAAGLDGVIGDWVVVMDPARDPPSLIPDMVSRARAASGIVLGSSTARGAEPLWYRAGSAVFHAIARRVLRQPIPAHVSHFNCLSRQAVNAITRMRDQSRYLRLLADHVGVESERFEYRPVERRDCPRAPSFWEAVGAAVGMLTAHSAQPLRFFSTLGVLASGMNLAYMGYVVAIYLFKDRVAEGWTTMSLQMSFMFFLVFLLLAALGEYVGRILVETRERPLYHVLEERNSNVLVVDADRRNVVQESVAS
jgi:dolichol-phosphate mannosyltransferase